MKKITQWMHYGALSAALALSNAGAALAQTAPPTVSPATLSAPISATPSPQVAKAAADKPRPATEASATRKPTVVLAPASPVAPQQKFSSGDTAWMLICIVLVMLMTMPGIILFYSGMLRSKNALSVVAHTVTATAIITVLWTAVGYSLAFTPGNAWIGDTSRVLAAGMFGANVVAHDAAPTVPEPVFFLFQLAFVIVTFAIILGSTFERMRLSTTLVFTIFWVLLIYAPVAHWIWQHEGWLAHMGHMDFAGGTVVHILAGGCGLVMAMVVGPRRGFGKEPMIPHNLMLTVIGAGLLWVGWFGFNAGSAYTADARAAGALLVTQVAACCGAILWGVCEYIRRGTWSVLGSMTGAIAGLVAITPASGYVDVSGALFIGSVSGVLCFMSVVKFKEWSGVDDSLDVFALHGVGGLVGTMLTPIFANNSIAPVTGGFWINTMGGVTVFVYAGAMTWLILKGIGYFMPLRVGAAEEKVGLDIAEHGEMLTPQEAS
jgi:ammonium transporter, Amt family